MHIHLCKIYFGAAITLVRLINGSTEYEGRVEVYHNGEWRTVCDDEWNLNDAEVVCRELGFGPAIDAKSEAFYGQGSNQNCFGNFRCADEVTTIRECSFNELKIRSHYSKDASVKCAASNGILYVRTYAHNYVHT